MSLATSRAIQRNRRLRQLDARGGSSSTPSFAAAVSAATSAAAAASSSSKGSFGVKDEHMPSIIAHSESNKSLRDLIARVNIGGKNSSPSSSPLAASSPAPVFPAAPSPSLSLEPTPPVPASFRDAAEALAYVESEVSRIRPGLLRATSVIGSALASNDSEILRLRRDVKTLRQQVRGEGDARALQRQLAASQEKLALALTDAEALRGAADEHRREATALETQLRTHQTGQGDELRTLRREQSTLRASLRQKDLELETVRQRERSTQQDLEEARRALAETEESCRRTVAQTKQDAEADRQALRGARAELGKTRATTRSARSEHEFEIARTRRKVEDLELDLRERTLKTAAKALHRMRRHSVWRSFSKMKHLAAVDGARRKAGGVTKARQDALAQRLSSTEARARAAELERGRAADRMAALEGEADQMRAREANMLNIISWLLDVHSGDVVDDQASHQFLAELRRVYDSAKQNAPPPGHVLQDSEWGSPSQ